MCTLEYLSILEQSLGVPEKFQRSSALPNVKYNCVVLFSRQMFWLCYHHCKPSRNSQNRVNFLYRVTKWNKTNLLQCLNDLFPFQEIHQFITGNSSFLLALELYLYSSCECSRLVMHRCHLPMKYCRA